MTMPNKSGEIVRKLVRYWNDHDAEKAAALFGESVEYWDVTQPTKFQKRSEIRDFFGSFFSTFPNLRIDILKLFAIADDVACEWRLRGTQQGEWEGAKASGKSIDIYGVSICTVSNGVIVRQTDYWDSGTLLRQLGAKS